MVVGHVYNHATFPSMNRAYNNDSQKPQQQKKHMSWVSDPGWWVDIASDFG